MFKSIKIRLFIWLITFFAAIMAFLGFFLAKRLDSTVMNMTDHLLSDKAELLMGLVHAEKGEIVFEISDIAAGDYSIKHSGHYFELTDAKGVSLVRSKSLDGFSFLKSHAAPKEGYFTETGPTLEPIRLFVHHFHPSGNERLTLFVAEGIRAELNLLKSFKVFLLVIFPMTILISGLCSIAIVWLSLRPLASFSRQIGTITEKKLDERVDAKGVDSELREIASSFNETMDRIEKAFQAQRDFLSDASHELRTPTTIIRTSAQLALRKERSVDEYKKAMETVKTASERMGGLVDRLLRLSRLDAELTGLKRVKLNLEDLLKTTLKTAMPMAEEREIGVYFERVEDITVEGDREQLIELFLSILDNAIKYNRPKGSVGLAMTKSDGWAVIRITDTGIGIAPEALDKVFDRFYRADTSRSETPGTGLGLPIAKGIAEAHGGRIEVESNVGKGTTFSIYLPIGM